MQIINAIDLTMSGLTTSLGYSSYCRIKLYKTLNGIALMLEFLFCSTDESDPYIITHTSGLSLAICSSLATIEDAVLLPDCPLLSSDLSELYPSFIMFTNSRQSVSV